jgi:hypothetical protein
LVASQNKDRLKAFELKKTIQIVPLQALDVSAIIQFKNGKKQKRELSYGSSLLSQSARFINVDSLISSITIKDSKGVERSLNF